MKFGWYPEKATLTADPAIRQFLAFLTAEERIHESEIPLEWLQVLNEINLLNSRKSCGIKYLIVFILDGR